MVLFTANQLVRYLVRRARARGVLQSLALRVQNVSSNRSRNQCFLAYWGKGKSTWFIKQPYFPSQYEAFGVANEARFYDLVNQLPALKESKLHEVIPKRIRSGYDATNRILILEELTGFKSLPENLDESGVNLSESMLPEVAAEVMRRVHVPLKRALVVRFGQIKDFVEYKPLLLTYQSAYIPWLLASNPAAKGTFLTALTDSLVGNALIVNYLNDLSNKNWHKQSLIHSDAAWRNFMFRLTDANGLELRLVDWEQACWGEPRWDHAVFFANYVQSMIDTRPELLWTHAQRFHKAYYQPATDQHSEATFRPWFRIVLQLAAVNLIQQTIDRFMKLVGTDQRRESESSLTLECQRWLRLLSNPFGFQINNYYENVETGICLTEFGK